MRSLWTAAFVLGLLAGAYALQRRYYFAQYVFFLRYPIFFAILLLFLPIAALLPLHEYIGNLFALERGQFWITAWLAVVAAWVIAYSGTLIYLYTPERVGLAIDARARPCDSEERVPANPWPALLSQRRIARVLFAFLALPLLISIWVEGNGHRWLNAVEELAGVALAFLLVWLGDRIARQLNRTWLATLRDRGSAKLDDLSKQFWTHAFDDRTALEQRRGWGPRGSPQEAKDPRSQFTHRSALGLALLSLAMYFAGCIAFFPGSRLSSQAAVPAIAFVLLLLIVLGWILPWLSFQLDKYRIPPEVLIIGIPAVLYSCFGTDHTFDIRTHKRADVYSQLSGVKLEPALTAWAHRGDSDTPEEMIIVAASGGGITAAYWSSIVLVELQRALGPLFARDLVLVSSTSGGSVGAVYYVNAFSPSGGPRDEELPKIVETAGSTSLDAMAWGLIYPDFIRLALPPLVPNHRDRGWAIEERWRSRLTAGDVPTLGSWMTGVAAGWRPATVFNSILVETGERFLLSTLDPPSRTEKGFWYARVFSDLCPNADIAVTTAARLSATFPYVTPISRPPDECKGKLYHVADGGYYDNYGVMSAIGFLDYAIPVFKKLRGDRPWKVALVEIRALDPSDENERPTPRQDAGFRFATIGPVEGMLATWSSSQIARSDLEVKLLESAHGDPEHIQSFIFALRGPSPLSWHLSSEDKERICRGWSGKENQSALRRVQSWLEPGSEVKERQALCVRDAAGE